MTIGAFSSFQTNPALMGAVNTPVKNPENQKTDKKKKIIETAKTVAPIAISVAAVPVAAIVASKMSVKKVNAINNEVINSLKDEIKNLSKNVADLKVEAEARTVLQTNTVQKVVDTAKKDNAQIWSAILAATGLAAVYKAGELSVDDKEKVTKKVAEARENTQNSIEYATDVAQKARATAGNSLTEKYVHNVNGVQLLKNNATPDKIRYNEAIKKIQTTAQEKLFNSQSVKPITNPNPVLWSITSEYAPIKEGGLGSVPVEVKTNMEKLGVEMPTFIPMYQQKGVANFSENAGNATYSYKNQKYDLEQAATYQIDTFRNGASKPEKVEVYVGTPQNPSKKNQKLIFIKNDNYFNGSIYQTTNKTEEAEKFAFFSKAVYEFAKAKLQPDSVKGLSINTDVFDSIKTPDGLVLNDWQASPVAALARYKAPMENAYGELNDSTAQQLSEMRIITIGHNAMYQGSTRDNNDDAQRYQATSNILNTLFDSYTDDIVSNAKTGATEKYPDDKGLKNLDNVLLLNGHNKHENHTNLLNMGICLSDYFHPVSQNYAKEIISDEHPELAGELRWALVQRDKAGSLYGIINGNDFNNLSIEAKKQNIKDQTTLDYRTYNKQSELSDVIDARKYNKELFYNMYMMPFTHKNEKGNNDPQVQTIKNVSSKLEYVESDKIKTELPKLTSQELSETPIISSVGRLVSQKGIDIMADAIKLLYKNWDKDFPGKNKPIFYIAGGDGEGGAQRKHIENLKENGLSQEDSNRVVFAHGFAPMAAITAASDFFVLPSRFEPCGLTQGEAFAVATPVIGSAVGGIVDTVNRGTKTNGILTDKSKPLTPEGLYTAMKEAMTVYFERPEEYQNMVKDSLDEDFSWIQKGKQGPVFDYLEKIGVAKESLPEIF